MHKIDGIQTYSIPLEKVLLSKRKSIFFFVYSGEWNISRRKRRGQSSSSCLSDSIESFWKGPRRREASFRLHSSSKKLHMKPNANAIKMLCMWVRLKEAQHQGLEFWQTKSFAIMTCFTLPRDCIDCVTAYNGDRVLFERLCDTKARTQGHVEAELSKPAAAARAAAAAHFTHRANFWKQRATWERKAEVQDNSKHFAEAEQVRGNRQAIHFSNGCGYSSQ